MLRVKVHPMLGAAALVALSACSDLANLPTAPTPFGPSTTVSTYAGQIIINEVMADPAAVTDANGEWLEVHNTGTAAVDLAGWTLASNNDSPQTIASSLSVPAGGYVVLARNGTWSTNGGVNEDYTYSIINLANTSDWVALRDGGGASVDSVSWATSMPAGSTRGVSDPSLDNLDAKGSNWHTSTTAFGAGDEGTPGARNDGKRGALVVRIIDAGQADAIFIENGDTRIILDAGQGLSRMANLISEFGMAGGTIDMMLMSHAHYDHHGGLREFFKTAHNIDIPIFFENKDAQVSSTLQELRDTSTRAPGAARRTTATRTTRAARAPPSAPSCWTAGQAARDEAQAHGRPQRPLRAAEAGGPRQRQLHHVALGRRGARRAGVVRRPRDTTCRRE